MSGKFKILILISLVLNFILIGLIAGYSYQHFGVANSNNFRINRGDKVIALLDHSSLPEVKRSALKEKLRSVIPNKGAIKDRVQWRDETLAILIAEDFDANAYRAQLEKRFTWRRQNRKGRVEGMRNQAEGMRGRMKGMRNRMMEGRRKRVEVMVEIASQLNQDERKALGEILHSNRFIR